MVSSTITLLPSPNFEERPVGCVIDTLILHYTGMPSAEEALARLRDPQTKVSAHYVIDDSGHIFQLVDDSKRAWHAGKSYWQGHEAINDMSIGIEIVNPGHEFGYRPFPDIQIESVMMLCHELIKKHPIIPRHIIGHSDIAPSRKEDPGELFPWKLLAENHIGLWHDIPLPPHSPALLLKQGDSGEEVIAMQSALAAYGYGLPQHGTFDEETAYAVIAFKRHFYPHSLAATWDEVAEKMLEVLCKKAHCAL